MGDNLSAAPPRMDDSFGAMLLSTIIVAALYGVTFLQTLYYYDTFPRDRWSLKSAVAVIWLLDTTAIILNAHEVYYYLVANYDNPPALLTQVWSAQAELLITYTVVVIAQMFYILRIYGLRPNMWYIPLAMGLLAIVSYVLVIVFFARLFENAAWSGVSSPGILRPRIANWATGMVVDIAITVVLCWYLAAEKTDYTRRSVHRGAIAAVVQIMTFLSKLVWPHSLVWLAFHNALSKVYANSMLATLNSRTTLRAIIDHTGDGSELTIPSARTRDSGVDAPTGRLDAHQATTLEFAHAPSTTLQSISTFGDSDSTVDYGRKE
ncbi:hypothetical protein C8Q77DRAFT_882904 [Trametes polyzona]|nr:hypothetical protein C8Q77DRAFT_882904 [Trametes polyzona]